jgi:osmotically-inducible protein OsmY
MYDDRDLQRAVIDELGWEPGVKASDIGVSVKDRVVTLTGQVDSYPEKWAAEHATKRLTGVRAVADEIDVRLPGAYERSDADIARAAENILDWNINVPNNQVRLTVDKGWITLEGTVDWHYQRLAAEKTVLHLTGVRGISNQIVLVKTTPAEFKSKIVAAFERNAKIDGKGIKIEVNDNKVILNGNVRSWAEREEAERVAWAAPGGCEVENHILVGS